MQNEKVSLSLELVNAILNYLGNQKYNETAALIGEIQKQYSEQSAPLKVVEDETKP